MIVAAVAAVVVVAVVAVERVRKKESVRVRSQQSVASRRPPVVGTGQDCECRLMLLPSWSVGVCLGGLECLEYNDLGVLGRV